VELKGVPSYLSGIATTVGGADSFGKVALGDSYDQRNGRAIRHISFEINARFTKVPGSTHSTIRYIMGIWKQSTDGLTPTPTQMLDLTTFSGAEYLSPINPQSSSNMVILMDHIFSINSGASTGTSGTSAVTAASTSWRKKFKYTGIQEYSGPEDTDVNNWNHFQYLISDSGDVAYDIGVMNYYTDA